MDFVQWNNFKLSDGFWKEVRDINRNVTIPHIYHMFKKEGHLNAYQNGYKEGDRIPHAFWDSEIAKWIEAVTYEVGYQPDEDLQEIKKEVADLCRAAQMNNGYLGIHFQYVEPELRWRNLRDSHEMYTGGHFIEAGVTEYLTGKTGNVWKVAEDFAEHIIDLYGRQEKPPWKYGAHPELEYALIRLYRISGDRKWLLFSGNLLYMRGVQPLFFVEEQEKRIREFGLSDLNMQNGNGDHENNYFHNDYTFYQSGFPCRDLKKAVGHAVCLVYLMSAMAAYASETGEERYLSVSRRVRDNLISRRMYITGGVGSSAENEGFTEDYDLPNLSAYSETCASVGTIQWMKEMFCADKEPINLDVMEKIMYNALLSGVSLDGNQFNYTNPLESEGNHHRQEWFSCACCPPNLARCISSVSGTCFAWEKNENGGINLFCCNYMAGTLKLKEGRIWLKEETLYPWEGDVCISIESSAQTDQLFLRIPGWCKRWSGYIVQNGVRNKLDGMQGWVGPIEMKPGIQIYLNFEMNVNLVAADKRVTDCIGKRAIQRGPLIYCIEQIDVSGSLDELTLNPDGDWFPCWDTIRGRKLLFLEGEGFLNQKKCKIKALPYFAWDNRSASAMKIWIGI
ncbi:MAG: glycoside hydrolase family 127 protein [Clostridiales bacterium]|nr:glycoside hydrolase family 127 protein [Clostridiales bacterium]